MAAESTLGPVVELSVIPSIAVAKSEPHRQPIAAASCADIAVPLLPEKVTRPLLNPDSPECTRRYPNVVTGNHFSISRWCSSQRGLIALERGISASHPERARQHVPNGNVKARA